jgi:signal transduction histidine kinase
MPTGESIPAGSGLGLALGKWIAERHGTELCVQSEPGCGACFSFELARNQSEVSASHAFTASLAVKD